MHLRALPNLHLPELESVRRFLNHRVKNSHISPVLSCLGGTGIVLGAAPIALLAGSVLYLSNGSNKMSLVVRASVYVQRVKLGQSLRPPTQQIEGGSF